MVFMAVTSLRSRLALLALVPALFVAVAATIGGGVGIDGALDGTARRAMERAVATAEIETQRL